MYRRYTQGRGETVPVSRNRHTRFRDILILILLLGLAVLAYFAIPAIRNNQSKRESYIQQIQDECGKAVETSQKNISRTAGTESYYSLAVIRSNLHAIISLDEAYVKAYSGRLLSDEQTDTVNTMLTMIRQYYSTAQAGSDTGQFATELQNLLRELQLGLDSL